MPDIGTAEKIANSEATWAILFIILLGGALFYIRYIIRAADRREQNLMDFYKTSKEEARLREEKLMEYNKIATTEMATISKLIASIQGELSRMNDRMDHIEKG